MPVPELKNKHAILRLVLPNDIESALVIRLTPLLKTHVKTACTSIHARVKKGRNCKGKERVVICLYKNGSAIGGSTTGSCIARGTLLTNFHAKKKLLQHNWNIRRGLRQFQVFKISAIRATRFVSCTKNKWVKPYVQK